MVDFQFNIGDRIRSNLDTDSPIGRAYTGVVTNIKPSTDEDGYNGVVNDCLRVTIKRDDKQPGSGFKGGWLTLVTEHNKHHISSLEWDLEVNIK